MLGVTMDVYSSEKALYGTGKIEDAIARKPRGHDFVIDRTHRRPAVSRHMSVTGG